jgi:prepilin-type N-terminal cleavage/methylation domain-containing protein
MRSYRERKGFTLIELLVVIAIIAILAAILFPVFIEAKARGRDTKCLCNLRQIGIAFKSYIADWNGRHPPAAGYWPEYQRGLPGYTWCFRSFVYLLRPYTTKNDKIFLCPSAPMKFQANGQPFPPKQDCGWVWEEWGISPAIYSRSHYGDNIAVCGMDIDSGLWAMQVPTESDIREPSRVIYLIDSRWVDLFGGNDPQRLDASRIRHHNGANTVCCDGHSKWVSVDYLNQWPMPKDAPVRWDYR